MKRRAIFKAMGNLTITNLTTAKIYRGWFIKPWQLMARQFSLLNKTTVSVVVVKATTMKRLNSAYHGQFKVTDVLSFNYSPAAALWEIIICYPQARHQAKLHNWPIKSELQLLFIHGLLHQLGFNDQTLSQQLKMDKEQKRWLQKLVKAGGWSGLNC